MSSNRNRYISSGLDIASGNAIEKENALYTHANLYNTVCIIIITRSGGKRKDPSHEEVKKMESRTLHPHVHACLKASLGDCYSSYVTTCSALSPTRGDLHKLRRYDTSTGELVL